MLVVLNLGRTKSVASCQDLLNKNTGNYQVFKFLFIYHFQKFVHYPDFILYVTINYNEQKKDTEKDKGIGEKLIHA